MRSQIDRGRTARRVAVIFAGTVFVMAAVAPVGPFSGQALADGPGGMGSDTEVITPLALAAPLFYFTSFTLPTAGGDIQAVVYDGNTYLALTTTQTTMTNFTAPSSGPITAKTTYVVVDGQCGWAPVLEPCVPGSLSGGSGDRLTFAAGGATLARGPDAFRGHDDCAWTAPGTDTCLWDTRTEDVSAFVAPGATSATVSVRSAFAADGFDCINHQAQVFAVGPTSAWAFGGYTADGTGLRNKQERALTIAGIPPTTSVVKALLYWNILNPSNPGAAMQLNGVAVAGTMIRDDYDPCWGAGRSWAFRADVTSIVAPIGNGTYTVSGYPSGSDAGNSPWTGPSPLPRAEGATLVVFYAQVSTPGSVTLGGHIDPATGELVDGATLESQSAGSKATFGGNVRFAAGDAAPTGNFRYLDHAVPEDIKATSFTMLVIGAGPCGPDTHALIRFTATENGVPDQEFKLELDDCGEPGSSPGSGPDMLSLQKLPAGYAATSPLVGGNVQIRKD